MVDGVKGNGNGNGDDNFWNAMDKFNKAYDQRSKIVNKHGFGSPELDINQLELDRATAALEKAVKGGKIVKGVALLITAGGLLAYNFDNIKNGFKSLFGFNNQA